ncbi:MAG: Glu/Leu/Phe/Val dehydrogenase [Candidatus Aenigmatarchaeota archaeon]|nr:MAG: Glu/Leu/Phe/Val dehydrogenase [Candidatus Aenigmarchaeota archaeon]
MQHDDIGPEVVLDVYDPCTGMRGFVVIDNTNLGPGKGGIRMTPTVKVEEVFRLARAMTWKNALAGLPFGGEKSGIVADDRKISPKKKKELVKAFSKAVKVVSPAKYIAAPDMNMGEEEIKWFVEANGSRKSATGKPKSMGGLPHELGSTGFGVYQATLVAAKHIGLDMKKATVAIEGFGNVGSFVGKFLSEYGARIVAASDSKGVIHNNDGLDFKKLAKVKKRRGSVTNYRPGSILCCEDILDVNADVLITAAVPDLIKPADVKRLHFKLIVEGSNIPMTHDVEKLCHKKGILVIPDFVANAGGVISSYVEYKGGSEHEMFKVIEEKINKNTQLVLDELKTGKCENPRKCAMNIAERRIEEAC